MYLVLKNLFGALFGYVEMSVFVPMEGGREPYRVLGGGGLPTVVG